MVETLPGKTGPPVMFTEMVNIPGTLAGIPKSCASLDLRRVWYRPNHSE